MFRINLRLTKFLKDGLAIASGRSVRVRKLGLQFSFLRVFKVKFPNSYLILTVEFSVF